METWYRGKTDDVPASLDIKTAFDEAKPKHVAKISDGHNTHGWLIAALLREIATSASIDVYV